MRYQMAASGTRDMWVVVGCVQARAKRRTPGCSPDVEQTAQPGFAAHHTHDLLTVTSFVVRSAPLSDRFRSWSMGWTGDSPLEQALAGGKPQHAGWFRLYFDGEQWEWSPEVERLHGYEPGTVQAHHQAGAVT